MDTSDTGPRRPSFTPVLRHPLVVGALLALLSGVFASLLIPALTRSWQDRPKELALNKRSSSASRPLRENLHQLGDRSFGDRLGAE
jgi:hypothetical protein